MQKTFKTVEEMIESTIDDPAFAKSFKDYSCARKITMMLTVLRCSSGMTEEDFAMKAGCSLEYVEEIENGKDDFLAVEDLLLYAKHTDTDIHVVFTRDGKSHKVQLYTGE